MFKYTIFNKIALLCTPIWLLAVPNAPTDLVLIPSLNSVSMNWKDTSYDETGFKIYRDDVLVGYTQAGLNRYTDNGLTEHTKYKYTVKSTNDTISSFISSGETLEGIADKENYKYYKIDVLAGETVSVKLHDMDADGDLFVRAGIGASKNSFDCKSANGGQSDESCTLTLTEDATIYIAVYAYKCINNVQHKITVTVSNATQYGQMGSKEVLKEDKDGYKIYSPKDTVNPPVVLFFAGWGGAASQFTNLMEFIASHGYYVIGFDDAYYNDKKVIARLNDARDIADTSRLGIVGHSTGGSNALRYLADIRAANHATTTSAIVNLDGYFVTDTTPDKIVNLNTNTLILAFGGVNGTEYNDKLYQDVKLNLSLYNLLKYNEVDGENTAFLHINANEQHSYPTNSDNYMSKQDLLVPVHKYLNAILKDDQNAQDILNADNSNEVKNYIDNGAYNANDYTDACYSNTMYDYCKTNDVTQIISNYKKLGEN